MVWLNLIANMKAISIEEKPKHQKAIMQFPAYIFMIMK